MKCVAVCVFALFQVVRSATSQTSQNDICTLRDTNSTGKCTLFTNCAPAIENLRKGVNYPQICRFEGQQPVVCCPNNENKADSDKHERMSQKKCKEYSNVHEEIIPPVAPATETIRIRRCGLEKISLIPESLQTDEFPFMALIGYGNDASDYEWLSTGVLISEQHVLTTATFLSNPSLGPPTVVALNSNKISNPETQNVFKVLELIPHPEYTKKSLTNDLAVLKLEKPVKLDRKIFPACLNTGLKTRIVSVGWENYGNQLDLVKEFAFLCNHNPNNNSKEICVDYGTRPPYDKSKELSGKVLLAVDNDVYCMHDLVGITSHYWRRSVKTKMQFVNVSEHVDWIEQTVWPQL
ncbi:hypothetical protein Zmor_000260 [Zophobas morio]|uniref:Peptidase S1 domain-containing protein n=1 Tax=Zophobas morio TaxID=2755281 RepID=A0AA38IWE9_9CUCU|nr:hypothetical protein Zmor_000260 [Zophobas morio]